jgi:tetratricopeptide (TPR) repeat protein
MDWPFSRKTFGYFLLILLVIALLVSLFFPSIFSSGIIISFIIALIAILNFISTANPVEKPDNNASLPLSKATVPASSIPVIEQPDRGLLPEIWNTPHRRNPNFTGRDVLLKDLHDSLTSGEYAAVNQAISGLGGVGKTQLAVEYAYRYAADYRLVWWLRAEDPATLAADYAGLADRLNLPEKNSPDQWEIIRAVRTWLEHNPGWLLIFDNAQQPRDLHDPANPERQYLPSSPTGHVIITSRNPQWGGIARSFPVKPFERPESIRFLSDRTGQRDDRATDLLAEQLGDLPLALEQAGAYIAETPGSTIAKYLDLFQKRHAELLNHGKPLLDYKDSVDTTWRISMDKIRSENENTTNENAAAADLLNLFAFFAPDTIPLALLEKREKYLPASLGPIVNDTIKRGDALTLLRRYSLVESSCDTISLHRLVQLVTRDRLDASGKKLWSAAAVLVVDDAFDYQRDNMRTWQECLPLLPHAQSVADHAEQLGVLLPITSLLLNKIGSYLQKLAELQEAKRCFERALAIDEKEYGLENTIVARDVNNLGGVLHDLGYLPEAKRCYERALAIDEDAHGPEHPSVAIDINNLGSVIRRMGYLPEAKKCIERALAIDEKTYGLNHLSVAIDVNNLGGVLREMGDRSEAKKYFERALSIGEKVYEPEHPEVARYVNNLGYVLKELGDLPEAKKCFERALSIGEKVYGPEHPEVAQFVTNLGEVQKDLGDRLEAKKCFERALVICENRLGEHHSLTETVRKNISRLND